MPLPEGAIIELTYLGTMYNQTIMNVRHYYVAAQGTTPGVTDEIENFLGHFVDMGVGSVLPAYIACIPEELNVNRVIAQVLTPTRLRRQFETISQNGLASSSPVTNVQASITFTTLLSGKDQQGGMRLCAAPVAALDGVWTAGYQGLLTTLAARLSETVAEPDGDAIYAPCIYHRTKAAPLNRTEITGFVIQPTTRVIRRRTVGVGV
jgi:hypothetical protein